MGAICLCYSGNFNLSQKISEKFWNDTFPKKLQPNKKQRTHQ